MGMADRIKEDYRKSWRSGPSVYPDWATNKLPYILTGFIGVFIVIAIIWSSIFHSSPVKHLARSSSTTSTISIFSPPVQASSSTGSGGVSSATTSTTASQTTNVPNSTGSGTTSIPNGVDSLAQQVGLAVFTGNFVGIPVAPGVSIATPTTTWPSPTIQNILLVSSTSNSWVLLIIAQPASGVTIQSRTITISTNNNTYVWDGDGVM